jgi:hypothetical protein
MSWAALSGMSMTIVHLIRITDALGNTTIRQPMTLLAMQMLQQRMIAHSVASSRSRRSFLLTMRTQPIF